ncbi:MAG: ABC transporter substrate-binding protein [Thermodesulfobacteriota bacterium]|nr:ABC transporter substrate-binding protein [Thermodesulfobacteriota bacterium]
MKSSTAFDGGRGLFPRLARIWTLKSLPHIWAKQSRNHLSALLVVCLLILPACAPAPVPKREWVPVSPEITIALESFERAERLFQEKAYLKALAIYEDYLAESSRGPLADAAWMKIGLIYMAMERYPQSRKAFQTLLSEYADSPFVEDTRFNVMLTYYKEGDYKSAARFARSALGSAKTTRQKFRINYLLGYTYSASRHFKYAITSFMEAYHLTSLQGRKEILSSVKKIIPYLKEGELTSLLQLFGNRVPGGYLRLQLAKKYVSQDRIDPAINVLSDFIRLFPDHDEMATALALMEELKSAAMVDRFLIGCVLPLTGPYGTFGTRALTGIELALHQFNSQPHVHPIDLVIRDSKGDPKEASRAVESLTLTDKVTAIIGPMITSESAAMKAQELKVPILTLTQKPNITETGDFVFRDFVTLSLQVKAIVDYAVDDLGLQRFAILYPDEPYGVSFMNKFWDELMSRGAEVTAIESYGPEQTDFGDPVKRLVGLYYPRPEMTEEEMLAEEEAWTLFAAPGEDETAWLDIEQPLEFMINMADKESLSDEYDEYAEHDQYNEYGPHPEHDDNRTVNGAAEEEPVSPAPEQIVDVEVTTILDGYELDLEEPLDFFYDTDADKKEPPPKEREGPQPIIDFEAIFIPESYEKVALIAPQFLYNDVSGVLLLGTNLWHSDKLVEMARGHVQGAVVPDGFFVDSPSVTAREFVEGYKEVFGGPPAFLEAQAYDAAWILFQAVNHPRVWSRKSVKKALMEILDFQGVTGVTTFDETGDVVKDLYLLKIEGRRFVQIKP